MFIWNQNKIEYFLESMISVEVLTLKGPLISSTLIRLENSKRSADHAFKLYSISQPV